MLVGCFVIFFAIVLCTSTLTFALDRICYGNLTQRLPIYPNATVQSSNHNLFEEFGMGSTVIVLTSPDNPDTVRSWYAVRVSNYLKQAVANNTPFYRLADGNVDVEPADQSNKTSQIFLYGKCVD